VLPVVVVVVLPVVLVLVLLVLLPTPVVLPMASTRQHSEKPRNMKHHTRTRRPKAEGSH
jgi:hypothetical protein